MRDIKFRALLNDGNKKWWEYYTTFSQPAWLDLSDVEITVKDLQYIGLKDIRGAEIYEGDIIKAMIPDSKGKLHNREIYWDNDLAHWGMRSKWGNKKIPHITPSFWKCEVTGNIYENPELMETKC